MCSSLKLIDHGQRSGRSERTVDPQVLKMALAPYPKLKVALFPGGARGHSPSSDITVYHLLQVPSHLSPAVFRVPSTRDLQYVIMYSLLLVKVPFSHSTPQPRRCLNITSLLFCTFLILIKFVDHKEVQKWLLGALCFFHAQFKI